MGRASRSVLVACVLCMAGASATAVAPATTTHGDNGAHRRSSHVAKACRRARHHRCPRRHKHKRKRRDRPPAATHKSIPAILGPPSAPPAPGITDPQQPVIEGSPPGAGATPPGSGDGPPVVEAPAEPPPARVQVIAKEYSFTLSRAEIPAGRVILEFVNDGEDPHNLHAIEPVEGSEAGEVANTASGEHEDLALTMRPGSYTLFCSLPKHEEKGMKATLVVN